MKAWRKAWRGSKAEGKAEAKTKMVCNLHKLGFLVEQMAQAAELSCKEVEEILKKHCTYNKFCYLYWPRKNLNRRRSLGV